MCIDEKKSVYLHCFYPNHTIKDEQYCCEIFVGGHLTEVGQKDETLHNVKASSMLCSRRIETSTIQLQILNIVRSECLRIWCNYIPGCVMRVLVLMHTFVVISWLYRRGYKLALSRSSARLWKAVIRNG